MNNLSNITARKRVYSRPGTCQFNYINARLIEAGVTTENSPNGAIALLRDTILYVYRHDFPITGASIEEFDIWKDVDNNKESLL